jgi:hypothetical protein
VKADKIMNKMKNYKEVASAICMDSEEMNERSE